MASIDGDIDLAPQHSSRSIPLVDFVHWALNPAPKAASAKHGVRQRLAFQALRYHICRVIIGADPEREAKVTISLP